MIQEFLLKQTGGGSSPSALRVMLVVLIGFLFKSLVVMLTYNSVGPKLTSNVSGDNSEFRKLSFTEAMAFTLLANSLFT